MKKTTKSALGIMAVTMVMGTMMATAAFAGDSSPREKAWDREFAAKPYVAVEYTPQEYKLARERGDMDEMWDAEFLATAYADVHYDSATMQAANEEAKTLGSAR